ALLAGAGEERGQLHAVADVERTDAFGRIELVTGDRQQIDGELVHVHRHLADRLRRIDVDKGACGARHPRDLGDRLYGPDLVLGGGRRVAGGGVGPSVWAPACAATRPSGCGATRRTGWPSRSSKRQHSSVAGCSIVVVTTACRSSRALIVPRIAILLASVPPLVKTISSARAPISAATSARACSTPSRARRPSACDDDGLPKSSRRNGSISFRTSGSTGVVALWSR